MRLNDRDDEKNEEEVEKESRIENVKRRKRNDKDAEKKEKVKNDDETGAEERMKMLRGRVMMMMRRSRMVIHWAFTPAYCLDSWKLYKMDCYGKQ